MMTEFDKEHDAMMIKRMLVFVEGLTAYQVIENTAGLLGVAVSRAMQENYDADGDLATLANIVNEFRDSLRKYKTKVTVQ